MLATPEDKQTETIRAEQSQPTVPRSGLINEGERTTGNGLNPGDVLAAWDDVGDKLRKLTKDMMQKQASAITDRFREGNPPVVACHRPAKRRKCANRDEEQPRDRSTEVSDSESEAGDNTNTESGDAKGQILPSFISAHVDRMARMSKYVMEIDYCHRMIRQEMQLMDNQDD